MSNLNRNFIEITFAQQGRWPSGQSVALEVKRFVFEARSRSTFFALNKNCARFVGSQAGAKDFHAMTIFQNFIKLTLSFSSTVTILLYCSKPVNLTSRFVPAVLFL